MTLCRVEAASGVYHLWLDRPEARNALSAAMVRDLAAAIKRIGDAADARCVIVAGRTSGAFCAGADLKERQQMTELQAREAVDEIGATVAALAAVPVPVIAAVRGVALGGGLELALACDLRVAASDAVLGLPETRLAIIPGAGGTQRLARIAGMARAKEWIFTGRRFSGAEALAMGVVDRAVPDHLVLDAALDLAGEICRGGPLALRAAKQAIEDGFGGTLAAGLQIERAAYDTLLSTEDRREGLLAFREKRPPQYRGM